MPQIIEINGENVEFPDGMTDDQIASAIKGMDATQGADSPLTQEQTDRILPVGRPTDMGQMPDGMPLPYGMDPKMIQAQNETNAKTNAQNAAMRQDPSMLVKLAEADKQGWLEGIGRGAMNTVNEMGTGLEDLADKYLPSTISNILNYRPFGDNLTPEQRIIRRQGEMEKSNEDQLVRTLANPISTTVGSMLPYFGTGRGLELGIDAIAKTASPITKTLIHNTMSTAGKLEGRGSGFINTIGDKANTLASRMENAPAIPSDFSKRLAYGVKAPIIGAAEGGANYNQSAGEGALMSLAGAGAATFGPLRMLDKVENVRDPYTKSVIKEMDRAGFSLTPGVKTGNRQMQTEEAGMKNSDVLGDYYHQTITRPNQRKMTEMSGDAIGLNMKGRDNFSTEELQGHMDSLSAQYKKLEADTSGKFTQAHFRKATDILDDLKPVHSTTGQSRNTSPDDATRYAKVKSITDQIKSESAPGPGVGGALNRTFDGTQYQTWRQRIQDETTQAFQNGDRRLGNALSGLRTNLDNAMEQSMGKPKASEWKDLNERYAMTNLLATKGLTPMGAVDPTKITSAVMNGDEALRTLTGRGGRIKNFQKIARYNDVLGNVEGGSLTGLGASDYAASRDIGKLPFRYKLPLYARASGRYRLGQIPTWGFGPTASLQTGRALMQTEPVDKAYEGAKMGVEELLKMIRGQ